MKNENQKIEQFNILVISEQQQSQIKGGGFATLPLGGIPPEQPIL